MEILQKIHSITVENLCFEEVYRLSGIQALLEVEVDKLSAQGNIADEEEIANQILFKLTIIHRIFNLCLSEKTTCGRLIDICNYLVDNNAVSILTPLLNVSNQLIVYMATKTVTSMILYEPYLIKKYKLQRLFLDCQKFEWKANYIMEMLKQILSHLCGQDEKNLREMKTSSSRCSCISSAQCSCKHKGCSCGVFVNFMIEDRDTILSSYSPLWKDILDSYISMAQDFEESSNISFNKLLEVHEKISLEVKQKACENDIEISSKDEQILLSFLQFLSVFRRANFQSDITDKENNCKKCQETSHSGNLNISASRTLLKIIPVFAHILQARKLSSQVWKAILELLSYCTVVNNVPTDNTDRQMFLFTLSLHTAAAVVSSISVGALDNIPLHHGFEGFGGEVISLQTSDEMQSCSTKPNCRIFRQISLLVLRSLLIMLKHFQECRYAFTTWCNHLHIQATESKVDISKRISEETCCKTLLEVFADQDEEMVEMMLLLLKSHKTLIQKDKSDQVSSSIIKVFNPHLIFVEFLVVIHFDHSVLVDFLISSETVFLEYLLEYLRLVVYDWEVFCQSLKGQVTSSGCCQLSTNSFELKKDLLNQSQETVTDSSKDKMEASRFDCVEKRSVIVSMGCLSDIGTSYASDSDDDDDIDDDGSDDDDDNNDSSGSEDDVNHGNINTSSGRDDGNAPAVDDVDDSVDNNDVGRYGSDYKRQIHEDVEMSCTNTISNTPVNATPESHYTLEKTMSTLIHTRISIERLVSSGLFPYNVTPLLRILNTVENMYDGC